MSAMSQAERCSAFASVIRRSPILQARIYMATERLKMDLSKACWQIGVFPTAEELEQIILEMPVDLRSRLLAERT